MKTAEIDIDLTFGTDHEGAQSSFRQREGREPTKQEVIKLLEKNGNRRDWCVQYADAYAEYQEATENIDKNGLIVQHPRTMNPIDNPYMAVRDRALKKLQGFRVMNTKGLW